MPDVNTYVDLRASESSSNRPHRRLGAQLQDLGEKVREDQKEMTRQLRTISRQLEQLEQTLKSQQKVLDAVPELQAQVPPMRDGVHERRASDRLDASASGEAGRWRADCRARRGGRRDGPRSSSIRFLTS